MDDLPELKGRISELSPSELFKMVNEEIVEYRKEEIALEIDFIARRGKARFAWAVIGSCFRVLFC